VTLLSVAIRPAVNGYIVSATYSGAAANPPFAAAQSSVTELLFTDLPSIGAFLTAQEFVTLPAPATPAPLAS
jgi:hypothetical protein